MCIIIDACCANSLANSQLPQAKILRDWIKSGGKVVSGGRLEQELKGTALQSLIIQWSSSGRLVRVDSDKIAAEESLIDTNSINSNDPHVIALARITGAEVIVTRDKPLIKDLKLIDNSEIRRKIYPFPENAETNPRRQREILRSAGCK